MSRYSCMEGYFFHSSISASREVRAVSPPTPLTRASYSRSISIGEGAEAVPPVPALSLSVLLAPRTFS